jgi:hypothetical protein
MMEAVINCNVIKAGLYNQLHLILKKNVLYQTNKKCSNEKEILHYTTSKRSYKKKFFPIQPHGCRL